MELDRPFPTPAGAPQRQGVPDRTGSWVLDRFQLRRALRRLQHGDLWLGRERDTRRSVVVRIGADPSDRERVRRAAAALAKVRDRHPDGCPGVVGFVAADAAPDGTQVLVTDHVEGAGLGKILWWTRFAPPRAVATVLELCAAVGRCHAAGVVVGDADPDDVLVARDDRGSEVLWLVGFEGAPAPMHAAPEVLSGAPADERSDVYGLGLLLYRLLAGRWPFEGHDDVVVAAQLGAEPPPLGRNNPKLRLPRGLEALVLRCLAKRPQDRFATVGELEEALRPLATVPQRDWVAASGAEITFVSEEATLHRRVEPPLSAAWLLVPAAAAALVGWWAFAS